MKTDCIKYKGCAVKVTHQFCLSECVMYENKAQITIEQAKEMIDVCGWNPDAMCDLKKHGYILPDPVEEAEVMFRLRNCLNESDFANSLIDKQHEAIQYLQQQLKARPADGKQNSDT